MAGPGEDLAAAILRLVAQSPVYAGEMLLAQTAALQVTAELYAAELTRDARQEIGASIAKAADLLLT